MANLIVQHWCGPSQRWAELAEQTIRMYSKNVGAEYLLIKDYPMGDMIAQKQSKPYLVLQKLYVLNEAFDHYDDVLLLDMDMIATKVMDNIFNYPGIGRLHKKGMSVVNASKNGRKWPTLYKQGELRFALKKDIIDNNMSSDELPPNDEILLHHLLYVTGILKDQDTLELPHDRFCDLPEEAHQDATLLHFCGGRKWKIEATIRNLYGCA